MAREDSRRNCSITAITTCQPCSLHALRRYDCRRTRAPRDACNVSKFLSDEFSDQANAIPIPSLFLARKLKCLWAFKKQPECRMRHGNLIAAQNPWSLCRRPTSHPEQVKNRDVVETSEVTFDTDIEMNQPVLVFDDLEAVALEATAMQRKDGPAVLRCCREDVLRHVGQNTEWPII